MSAVLYIIPRGWVISDLLAASHTDLKAELMMTIAASCRSACSRLLIFFRHKVDMSMPQIMTMASFH